MRDQKQDRKLAEKLARPKLCPRCKKKTYYKYIGICTNCEKIEKYDPWGKV